MFVSSSIPLRPRGDRLGPTALDIRQNSNYPVIYSREDHASSKPCESSRQVACGGAGGRQWVRASSDLSLLKLPIRYSTGDGRVVGLRYFLESDEIFAAIEQAFLRD